MVVSAAGVVVDVVEVLVDVVEVLVDVVEVLAGEADAVVLRVPTVRKIPAAMAFRADDGRNACRRR